MAEEVIREAVLKLREQFRDFSSEHIRLDHLPKSIPDVPPSPWSTQTGHDVMHVALISLGAVFLGVFLLDFLFIRWIMPKGARYFLLHVCFNSWLSMCVFKDAMDCLLNPLDSFRDHYVLSVTVTTAGISAFHVYHMCFFTNLSREDVIHHLANAFIAAAIGISCPFGYVVALSNLAMCGIPGGLDYLMLTLVKLGWMDGMTEKFYNRWLNLVVRWPLQLLVTYIGLLNYAHGNVDFAPKYMLVSIVGSEAQAMSMTWPHCLHLT